MRFAKTITIALLSFACLSSALAQSSEAELERRSAAAGFMMPIAFALGILRQECRQWLAGSDADVDQIARGWWERNRDDLDAATWIFSEATKLIKSSAPAEKAAASERTIVQGMVTSALNNLRLPFQNQVPTPETCRRAMQQYKASQLDISRLGSTKGYEQFSEFGETLKRARSDPTFLLPGDKERTFENQVSVVPQPIFSLNIIEMFKQQREWQGVTKGFESLADRGDATAAQTLGIFYLNGQYVARNPQVAFAWFYHAWVLGDPEGINAIGVIWRDGAGVAADKKLALASFAISRQMMFNKRSPAYQRSNQNFNRISAQMQPNEISEAGCLKWEDVHQRFRQIAATATTTKLPSALKLPTGTLLDTKTMEPVAAGSINCSG